MANIIFDKVHKFYGKVPAVKTLSFECKNGEFFAILGPSGCGKSSTLRMLAGLEEISQGDVFIGQKRVNQLGPSKRNVAMSFENFGLYPHLTIYENIAYPLKIRGTAKDEIKKKVLEIAGVLKIRDILNSMPDELSSGQKQRVSIARALVRNPDVTIMDEPLSHLDSELRGLMRTEIKKIHENLGLTTIYVTHDQLEAMTMADKILILNNGELQQIGTPDEVYFHPANDFVAGFIGSPQMNFLECELGNEDGHPMLQYGTGIKFKIQPMQKEKLKGKGNKIKFGIRPHDIRLSMSRTQESDMEGVVYITEPLGETTIVTIKVGDVFIKAETVPDFHANMDEKVFYNFNVDHSYFFDIETGKAYT